MRIKLAFFIFIFFFRIVGLQAGITGKLSGNVIDKETGEALTGANIMITGTSLGAASDIDGNYTILNIPPGKYTVKFRFMGYSVVSVQEVQINVDFTTRLDQGMSSLILEMGEVTVIAKRASLVKTDLTNTQVALSAETIENLPIDELDQLIKLQPGITTDNSGGIHIRGGRSNEIATQINGISVANPFDNSQAVGIATNAVQEVSVSAGTFSAEYGNALSGVINYVTKEGGNELSGTFKTWTGDHVSSKKNVFYGIDKLDPLNKSRMEATLGGPIPGMNNKMKFFLSGVVQKDKGFLYGIDVYKPEDIMVIDGESLIFDP